MVAQGSLDLQEPPEKFHTLEILVDKVKTRIIDELELSLKAGEIVAKIYDALLIQYINPNAAESVGIFGKYKIFRDYLAGARNIRRNLFKTFNTPTNKRNP